MVQIVTDSSVLYTREEGKELGIEVMPLCISIGDLDIRLLDLGAAFVTQGGPQCVAIQYIEK